MPAEQKFIETDVLDIRVPGFILLNEEDYIAPVALTYIDGVDAEGYAENYILLLVSKQDGKLKLLDKFMIDYLSVQAE